MSATQVKSDSVRGVLELLQSYGPNVSGYVIAMVGFSLFMWLLSSYVRSSHKSMQQVWAMGEGLRESMRKEKEKCEEECRRKDEIIEKLQDQKQQLIELHSSAREAFLQEAIERDRIHRRQLDELAQMQAKLVHMEGVVESLTAELERQRNQKRRTDP